jgi:glycosyltransferase involved in cell wall biosynthesis
MDVLFAPDWRNGAPYQQLLAEALGAHGVRVSFLGDYRRGLPLARLVRGWRRGHGCDLLHLHWPEAYYPRKEDGLDWFRFARFPVDLWLATRGLPLAVTAHNLQAHNRRDLFARRNTKAAFRRARVVFAHSEIARGVLEKEYGVPAAKTEVIPNGDLTVMLGEPISAPAARAELGLGEKQVCLMFGAVEPYKGIEEAIGYWRSTRPDCELHIAGKPCNDDYAAAVRSAAEGAAGVHLHLGWLSEAALRAWLSAADCALFNYRSIFNSGSAPTARAFGVPVLLPARLETVELGEPHPRVIRFRGFEEDFGARLREALALGRDDKSGREWREATSWESVAEITAGAYRRAVAETAK